MMFFKKYVIEENCRSIIHGVQTSKFVPLYGRTKNPHSFRKK